MVNFSMIVVVVNGVAGTGGDWSLHCLPILFDQGTLYFSSQNTYILGLLNGMKLVCVLVYASMTKIP